MTFPSYDPTDLIAGSTRLVNEKITVLSGEGVLKRGTVLGKQSANAASAAAKSGGNTGNGVFTLDGTTPVKAGAKAGVYTVRCIAAATNSGTFRVSDPDGFVLGDVAVAATFDNDIKFSIADGATDFIVGDGFDVTVTATGKFRKAVAAANDGSAVPRCVLAFDIDATSNDVDCQGYYGGDFADELVTYGAGHTKDTVNAAFRDRGVPIFIRSLGAVG